MKKVYIIDDDQFYLKLISKKLWELGYTVKTFHSVEQALPNLEETPDVIVLDHNFGYNESKGIDYIPLLKMHAKSSSILYVTSESTPDIINSSLERGADKYLKKNKEIYDRMPQVISDLLSERQKIKRGFWTSLFKSRS